MKFFRVFAVTAFFLVLPSLAHAMVITEIYYNPVGTDTGHEFIEIYNDESEPVDLTGWKLFEVDTNHGLAAYEGDMVLAAGQYAVIADQPAQVAADFPGIGTLFDSAFSLNNTGEMLALKNQSLSIIDQATYASSQGGSEDGGSLNKIDSSWVSRTPTPGAAPASAAATSDDTSSTTTNDDTTDDSSSTANNDSSTGQSSENTNDTNTSSDTASQSDESGATQNQTTASSATLGDNDPKTKDPKYTLMLKTDNVITANDPTTFEGILKRNDLSLLNGRFQWSLGDGTTFERNKLPKFDYTYHAPGTYVVVLAYYRTSFDDEPFLRVIKKINVIAGDVAITSIDQQGSVVLSNDDSKDIDLSDWSLNANGGRFVFGKNTFVLSGGTLSIPASVHRLPVSSGSTVILQNPSGLAAAQYPNPKKTPGFSQTQTGDDTNDDVSSNDVSSGSDDLSRIADNNQQASVAGADIFSGMWPWLFGLLGILMVVGIGCAVVLRKHHGEEQKGSSNEPDRTSNFSSDDIELLM